MGTYNPGDVGEDEVTFDSDDATLIEIGADIFDGWASRRVLARGRQADVECGKCLQHHSLNSHKI